MIACSVATTLIAPRASPLAMVAVIGEIIVEILALTLVGDFFLRFKIDKSSTASGEMESKM